MTNDHRTMELALTRPALLVLDMQNDLLAGKRLTARGAYDAALKIITPLQRLLAAARAAAVPVIYVVNVYRDDYIDAHRRSPSRKYGTMKRGAPGSDVTPELAPQAGDRLVEKHRPSAFYCTDLQILLKALKVETLLLAGISTPGAVSSTARDGFNYDYEVVLVSDCCAAEQERLHEAELEALSLFMARVMDSSQVIANLPAQLQAEGAGA